MKILFYTNKGKKRKNNQDAILVNKIYQNDMQEPILIENFNGKNLIVADGIGGLPYGELASKEVLKVFEENENEVLEKIIQKARKKLRQIKEDKNIKDLGTVLAGIIIRGNRATIFNVGDSRVYQVRGDFLYKHSEDHTFEGNIITSAVTSELENLKIYTKEIEIEKGDVFFICTDGVWGQLSEDELEDCIDENIQTFGEKLLEKLWTTELSDNLSFIIVEA